MKICNKCNGNGHVNGDTCDSCHGVGFIGTTNKEGMVDFVNFVCKNNGFSLVLEESEQVYANGMPCTGYFDSDYKKIVVAKNNQRFFTVLLHEFCHLRQFLEKKFTERWMYSSELDAILKGLKPVILKERFNRIINGVIDLEWDCEQRTIQLLKTLEDFSDKDLDDYYENCYLYMRFYKAVEFFRKWKIDNLDYFNYCQDNGYFEIFEMSKDHKKELSMEEVIFFEGVFYETSVA
jgi:hypothetical protein